jgi:hypothetical protein
LHAINVKIKGLLLVLMSFNCSKVVIKVMVDF